MWVARAVHNILFYYSRTIMQLFVSTDWYGHTIRSFQQPWQPL